MKRYLLPAALLLLAAVPSEGQYYNRGRDGAERTVADWYKKFLGRPADPQAGNWIEALRQGEDPDQVLSNILGSDEYYNRAGKTPPRFVRRIYLDIVGRDPNQREMNYWVGQVQYGSRPDVSYQILKRYSQGFGDDDDWRDSYQYRRPYNRYR